MQVGELHLQRAEAALSPSFLFFPLNPDWDRVSSEASLAAEAFRAANIPEKVAEAVRLGIKAEDELHHPLTAGTLMEQLGDILLKHKRAARRTSNSKAYAGAAAAAYEEALDCYREAVSRYKEAQHTDFAVSLLIRIAEMKEKEMSADAIAEAKKAYEEALTLRTEKGELHHVSEVYRHYICMLVRVGELKEAITVTLRRSKCLYELKQYSGIHKALLTVAVLFLALKQHSMADRTLSGQEALQSHFIGSPEFMAGAEAVDAYKARDGVAFAIALEAPVFRFLLAPVASLVAKMAVQAREWSEDFTPSDDEVGIPGEVIDEMLH